ncbi:hypothetical protein ACWEPB_09530 [Kitasatospora cineracea]
MAARRGLTPPAPTASGTAQAPITFAAAPGAGVTVDGTDPVTAWALDSGRVHKTRATLAGTAAAPTAARRTRATPTCGPTSSGR